MMKHFAKLIQVVGFWFVVPQLAQAYVGPGAGISAFGSLIVLVVALLVALLGFIWFPLKRLFKKNKRTLADNEDLGMDMEEHTTELRREKKRP